MKRRGKEDGMAIELYSTSFGMGEPIPGRHSYRGDNRSPQLFWSRVGDAAKSLVLLVEDPDIPLPRFLIPAWTHWIVYNIDPHLQDLPEGLGHNAKIGGGAMQGRNSFRDNGYDGPCPPFGTHRYFFRVFALDTVLDLDPGSAGRRRIATAMEGHVIGRGELMGTFSR
jgi:Raf kinase inhibitor-like YbhB/YbcL family protein